MPAEPSGDHEQTPHGESVIDDLILDILNEAGRAQGVAARGRPAPAASLLDLVLSQGARSTGGSLVERVLLAEVLAGAIADALAPALAEALAPRLLQVMEGGDGRGGGDGAQASSQSPAATKPATPRKTDAK